MINTARTLGILAVGMAAGVFLFSQTQESAQLFEKNKEGVLSLFVYGENKELTAKGVGFGLAEDVVVTSYHLVSRAEEVEAVNVKGKKIKVEGIIFVRRNFDKLGDGLSIIESSISIPDGYNGGPLLDLGGKAVGLAVVMEKSRVGIPVNSWKSLPKTGKTTAFKDWVKEDYFTGFEGAYLAGRIASLMDETLNAQT